MLAMNHFFVDGSALLGDIKRLRQTGVLKDNQKVCLKTVADLFCSYSNRSGGYIRFTYYFVAGDPRLESEVVVPDFTIPGRVEDIRIEYCGKRVKEFEAAQKWLDENQAPQHVRECFYRSEKAVDTQLCADALQFAAVNKLDRLYLYTNDYDFVPLCRALRNLGLNITIIRLSAMKVNEELVKECDSLMELEKHQLPLCFIPH